MTATTAEAEARGVLDEMERAVVGKRAVMKLVLQALLADGHVLLEDVPGVAKTLIARSFAHVTGAGFGRIQFTPDLLPADLTGTAFGEADGRLVFRPGPIFTNVLLGDEVNRAPPKTQAALLEAMEERQVTVEDRSHPLPRPFLVIATQNPIEFDGTYPLPEAQLDRFLVRLAVGHPDEPAEVELLARRVARRTPQPELRPVIDLERLRAMQAAVEEVHVDPDVGSYIVRLVRATRAFPGVAVGASPRAALALLQLARAGALLAGRRFVLPDDVKEVAVAALAHRLVLHPELWVERASTREIVESVLRDVEAPVVGRPA